MAVGQQGQSGEPCNYSIRPKGDKQLYPSQPFHSKIDGVGFHLDYSWILQLDPHWQFVMQASPRFSFQVATPTTRQPPRSLSPVYLGIWMNKQLEEFVFSNTTCLNMFHVQANKRYWTLKCSWIWIFLLQARGRVNESKPGLPVWGAGRTHPKKDQERHNNHAQHPSQESSSIKRLSCLYILHLQVRAVRTYKTGGLYYKVCLNDPFFFLIS